MIIVSIGYGRDAYEPFTYTCTCEDEWVNPQDVVALCSFIYKEHNVMASSLDRVLVIESGEIIADYDYEDGLGSLDQDLLVEG